MKKKTNLPVIKIQESSKQIRAYLIRDKEVMIDKDIAQLYAVETRYINYARKRRPDIFNALSFKMNKQDILSFEKKYGSLNLTNYHHPFVYSEEGCYKMSAYIDSPLADQVFDIMFKAFKAVKDNQMIPKDNSLKMIEMINQIKVIDEKIGKLSNQSLIQNNFNAPVNYIQGDNTVLNISNGASESFLMGIAQIMMDSKVAQNQELIGVLSKVLDSQSKKDKDGLLDNLKKLVDIGTGISSIASGVPTLIEMAKKLF